MFGKVKKAVKVLRKSSFRAALRRGVAASIEHDAVPVPDDVATVLDVGANRGQFAIYSCNRFPVAALHCFEPIPEARAKLEEVVPSNRNITVHNVALASVRGSVDFHVSVDDDSSSLLPASRDQIAMFPGSRRDRTISVRTERLDDVLADQELARPVLMKLDIQGAELEALKGAAETLAKTEYVLVECSFVELYDGQAFGDEVISFLRNVGFDLVGLYSPTIVDGLLLQADAFFTRRV